jgi:hypothetical protein
MALIEISNLNSAGSELFAGTDSFLNELQTTETTQIFGGYHKGHGCRKWKKTSCKIVKKTSYKPCKPPVKVACKPAPCYTKKWC